MAYRIVVMPAAQADLDEYAAYISRQSRPQARLWLNAVWGQIFSLTKQPQRFAVLAESAELGAEIRGVPIYSHRVVYRIDDASQTVEVLRVWHQARQPLDEDDLELPG